MTMKVKFYLQIERRVMGENYYLLNDMEQYDKTFNRKVYEHLDIKDLEPIFRDYYSKHLPIDVTTWIRVNQPDDNLIYKKGQGDQVCFLRDKIMRNMFYELLNKKYDYKEYEAFQPKVIGTHYSKSVLLPVMEIDLPTYKFKMIFRDNFYNWNISIESEQEVIFDHKGLINDEAYHYCYCEGFPKDKIYGKYQESKNRFTICIDSDYQLYVFLFLLKDWLKTRP